MYSVVCVTALKNTSFHVLPGTWYKVEKIQLFGSSSVVVVTWFQGDICNVPGVSNLDKLLLVPILSLWYDSASRIRVGYSNQLGHRSGRNITLVLLAL